ncbi:MAG: hypothetical protein GEU90_10025 [Gemmatimonas sp.]|nr:hypothetical protein [Gemmatimonas sp.]
MLPDLSEEDLRLRYLDWCSAQVARRFLELSHDEVWLRSHFAASLPARPDPEKSHSRGPATVVERIPGSGYLELVRKTALVLARELDLPGFEEWKQSYLEDPDSFKRDMLTG